MIQQFCCSGAFRCRLSSQHLPTLALVSTERCTAVKTPGKSLCVTTPIQKCRSVH